LATARLYYQIHFRLSTLFLCTLSLFSRAGRSRAAFARRYAACAVLPAAPSMS